MTTPLRLVNIPHLFEDGIVSQNTRKVSIRKDGFRCELDKKFNRPLIQNYGHQNALIPLSVGSSLFIPRIVCAQFPVDKKYMIAVVGANLAGLMTAISLAKEGHSVCIYSETTPDFNLSGKSPMNDQLDIGLFLPIDYSQKNRDSQFEIMQKISHDFFQDSYANKRYGSINRSNIFMKSFTFKEVESALPLYLNNSFRKVSVDFGKGGQQMLKLKTYSINVPLFIEEVRIECLLRGVRFQTRKFTSKESILQLKEDVIVNCSSAVGKHIFDDSNVQSVPQIVLEFNKESEGDESFIFKYNGKTVYVLSKGSKYLASIEGTLSQTETKRLIQTVQAFCSQSDPTQIPKL